MKRRHQMLSHRPLAVVLTILAAAASLGLGRGRADDRRLLRQTNADPYLFVILDTSGSMNERPADSSGPMASADDPESKMYQAKKALYEAIADPENSTIHFGFATFNQDNIIVRRKHWVYAPTTSPGWSGSALAYPVLDVPYVFGGENNGMLNTTQGGCNSVIAVGSSGLNAQVQQFPRTGDAGDKIFTMYVRQTGVTGKGYKTTTEKTGGSLGDPTITVRVIRRSITSCGPEVLGLAETKILTYQLIRTPALVPPLRPFPLPDNQPILAALERTSYSDDVPLGPTSGGTLSDGVLNSCSGLDLNSDSASDRYKLATTINLSYPLNRKFDRGDFLPLDWTSTNRDEILRRLAPNLRGMETIPDFTQGRYFQTTVVGGVATQNPGLVDPAQVPLIAQGYTPLGNSVNQFRDWYAGCHNDNTPTSTCATAGWKNVAETADPEFGCRPKYLLILTDGLDTCGGGGLTGSACEGVRILYSKYKIETFVIGFGQIDLSDPTNVLSCLANNGSGGNSGAVPPVVGTRPDPFQPTDEMGLEDALASIFQIVTQAGRSFSSAAVPTVQANFEDTIYVPNFTPLNATSFVEPLAPPPASPDNGAGATWDGHLNAYLKPIPVNATTGKPRTDILCTSSVRSGCFLWDAGAQLVTQAPTQAQLNPVAPATPLWNIGAADNQRRVFYAAAPTTSIPATRRLFLPQTTLATQQDLWEGMKFFVADTSNSTAVALTNQKVADVIKYTLQQKFAHVDATTDTRFVLGDIFHSNPVLVSAPGRITYFDADVPNPPGTNAACTPTNKGYRCFRSKYQLRRRLVAVGSNDGQLHLFDGGIYRDNVTPKAFDSGTGKEIFSFIPRPMLEHLALQSVKSRQNWGVDGTIQVDDVFIDPSHGGTPLATDREWRTVLLGGLREGGRAYYALDVTQPDQFDGAGIPRPLSGSTYVPSCWNGGTGCGTVPFGSVLWSFEDTSDEDGNATPDLGDTWSTPNTGRIRVVTNAATTPKQYEDHYVAVFGGGMDSTLQDKTGNWLYMVDVETGKILYKRVLDGSAPSDPAAVDTDLDGYIDRVYIGTTKGWLYKVDMTKDVALVDIGGGVKRITSTDWAPFKVFDTATARGTGAEELRPIYFPPSVVFDSKSGFFAVGFGTGNREDLWTQVPESLIEGRFYFLLDTGWHTLGASETPSVNTTLPKVESNFVQITTASALAGTGTNFLNSPPTGKQSGWVLNVGVNERLISKALTLSGILVFTEFDPVFRPNPLGVCVYLGTSNIFTVLATNGDAVLGSTPESRSRQVLAFVTNPFVETNISKNPRGSTPQPQNSAVCSPNSAIRATLRSLFPTGCKFTAFTQDIKTFQVDTKLECIAAIPVCVREQNWRDQ
jgi:hypothetical protein